MLTPPGTHQHTANTDRQSAPPTTNRQRSGRGRASPPPCHSAACADAFCERRELARALRLPPLRSPAAPCPSRSSARVALKAWPRWSVAWPSSRICFHTYLIHVGRGLCWAARRRCGAMEGKASWATATRRPSSCPRRSRLLLASASSLWRREATTAIATTADGAVFAWGQGEYGCLGQC